MQIADGATMVDVGGLNVSNRSTVQVGFINVTEKITSVQIGFVNVTNEIKSFQFGFLNIAKNGFLPVFPVFNFAYGK